MPTACDKSSTSNSGISQPPASGQWKVTYFFDRTDETSDFDGFTFEFKYGGVLVAAKGSQTWTGTWTGTWSDNCDNSSNKFCLGFSGSLPSGLDEITEDWQVVEIKDNFMHFEHVSGGDGHTEVLHFEK
jgi:hypothetical protein